MDRNNPHLPSFFGGRILGVKYKPKNFGIVNTDDIDHFFDNILTFKPDVEKSMPTENFGDDRCG